MINQLVLPCPPSARSQSRAAIRRRLFNPVNGHLSSSLDVISAPEIRRKKMEAVKYEDEIRKQIQKERLVQLAVSYVEAHRRSQFFHLSPVPDEPHGRPRVSFQRLTLAVCSYFRLPKDLIFSLRRQVRISLPRQILMYLAREYTTLTLPQIGRLIGDRDHTTCLHGHRKITAMLAGGDKYLIKWIDDIKANLNIASVASPCVADQSGRGEGRDA